MGEFFRGWKRKIGYITLFWALAFSTIWVSQRDVVFTADGFGYSGSNWELTHRGVEWAKVRWEVDPIDSTSYYGGFAFEVERKTEWSGFLIEEKVWTLNEKRLGKVEAWVVPYWSIVLPLTLIAAFLLLTKPRKSNQSKMNEPTANEGGATS